MVERGGIRRAQNADGIMLAGVWFVNVQLQPSAQSGGSNGLSAKNPISQSGPHKVLFVSMSAMA